MKGFKYTDEEIEEAAKFFAHEAIGSRAYEFGDNKFSTIAYIAGRFSKMSVAKAFELVSAVANTYYGLSSERICEVMPVETYERIKKATQIAREESIRR